MGVRNAGAKQQAEAALIYEECLSATTTKLVENSSWANASLLAHAISLTIWIAFDDSPKHYSNEQILCINAWIFFVVIFALSILAMFIPKWISSCQNTDGLRNELEHQKQINEAAEAMQNQTTEFNERHSAQTDNKMDGGTAQRSSLHECAYALQVQRKETVNESAEEKKI